MKSLKQVFETKKPVIGMLHLDYLKGESSKGVDYVTSLAKRDIEALQEGGVDAILIENWKEDSIGEFVSPETAGTLREVTGKIVKSIGVPFGFNILNNDYKVALDLAKEFNASFIELDVFVDHVVSNFIHSPVASKNPFEIRLNPKNVTDYARVIGAGNIPIFVFIQPKHYIMLEEGKTIEESTKQAIENGASAVLVTKETGFAPTIDLIKRVKKVAGNVPVGIGSGFSEENCEEYLNIADFAIVGTSIKKGGITDNPVDVKRVQKLMQKVKNLRTKTP